MRYTWVGGWGEEGAGSGWPNFPYSSPMVVPILGESGTFDLGDSEWRQRQVDDHDFPRSRCAAAPILQKFTHLRYLWVGGRRWETAEN